MTLHPAPKASETTDRDMLDLEAAHACAEHGVTACNECHLGAALEDVRKCRVCGCTDVTPCETDAGPCSWVEGDLCSACAEKAEAGDRFDPWEDPWPDGMFPNAQRKNAYTCNVCGGTIVTVDRVAGVTPAFLACRATAGCPGTMASHFYRVAADAVPAFEWVRPPKVDVEQMSDDEADYYWNGGLDVRIIPFHAASEHL